MPRMFCALMLGAELGGKLERALGDALGPSGPSMGPRGQRPIAPVRGADMHLTLLFAGALDGDPARRLGALLGRAFAGAQSPRLVLGRADAFPSPRRARVLVARVLEFGGTHLADLAARAARTADEAGLVLPGASAGRAPRPFAPHVTLARLREGRRGSGKVPAAFLALDFALPWQPRAAAWVESPGGGAPYRVAEEFPLSDGSRGSLPPAEP
jgi:2'-5' RNA ligase